MGAQNVYFSRNADGKKYMEGTCFVREFFKDLNLGHRVRILNIPPRSSIVQDMPDSTKTTYLCVMDGHVLVEEKATTPDTYEAFANDVFYITSIPYAINNVGDTPAIIFQVIRTV